MNKEDYLKKFHELKFQEIKSGIGILTNLENIDLENIFNKPGNTHYDIENADLIDENNIDQLEEKTKQDILSIINNPKLENKLDYLNAALRSIKILVIDKNNPVVIDRKIAGSQYNHLIVYVKENIHSVLIINTEALNNKSIATDFIDIIMEENSKLNFIESRNYGDEYMIYSRKQSHLKENSELFHTNIEGTAKLNITEIRTSLKAHSGLIINNLLLARNSEYNLFIRTDHESNNTKSLMQSRAIMSRSKAVLRGLINIQEDAANSNGYQKSDILMLDNESQAVSIPDLEIHNDEVRCTHGSCISKPDESKIFYLQSRGLSFDESQKLLIEGFYEKILELVPEHLKDDFREKIENILYLQE